MTTIEPTAWAVYGRKTGSLRDIVADDETARDLAEYYDVVPLYPAATPPADDVREALTQLNAALTHPGSGAQRERALHDAANTARSVLIQVRPRGTVTNADPVAWAFCRIDGSLKEVSTDRERAADAIALGADVRALHEGDRS